MSFASKLDILIEERGLNNLRLSKELGIGDRLIGAWRKGEKRPTLDNFVLLGEFLASRSIILRTEPKSGK